MPRRCLPEPGRAPPELLAVGVSHRTCPLDAREILAERVRPLRETIGSWGPWVDAVVLSTCNRVEVVALTATVDAAERRILDGFGLARDDPRVYLLRGSEAAEHLFRVASGLESVAQGECQVAGQVRRAARGTGALSRILLAAAEEAPGIRAAAGLTDEDASASRAAVRFLRSVIPRCNPTVAILGAGKMARIAADHLAGTADLLIVDADMDRASGIAEDVGGHAYGLESIRDVLVRTDALLTAVPAKGRVLFAETVRDSLARRAGRPLWIVDLAVPRNVDPALHRTPNLSLMDIDGLRPWGLRTTDPRALAAAERQIRHRAEIALRGLAAGVSERTATDDVEDPWTPTIVGSSVDRLPARTAPVLPPGVVWSGRA